MLSRRSLLQAPSLLLRRAAPPPNILFLLSDDQRWDSLGSMGNPFVKTPNLDALARRGTLFTNHAVTTAICMSSRASIMTGLHTRNHGTIDFNRQYSRRQLDDIYPVRLRRAGYRTGFIGKWGLDKQPLPSGEFDYWRGFSGQGRYFPKGEPGPHLTGMMAEEAIEFLQAGERDSPFCLSVSFKAPHVQDNDSRQFLPDPQDIDAYRGVNFPYPKTFDTRFTSALPESVHRSENRRRWAVRFSTPELFQRSVRNYYALITGIDRAAGRMIESLRKTGQLENTIIVYTSDNGFYLGEHGLACKWLMHEESIRVPLLAAGPGIAGGRKVDAMTLNIDLAPTLLSLAGAAPVPSMQGRSLVPFLRGNNPSWREEWFYEHVFDAQGWISPSDGVRFRNWKYIRYPKEDPVFEELYDTATDPLEERNLAGDSRHAAILSGLRKRREIWSDALDTWSPGKAWRDPI
jgi:arylsulfatase A-like enzyme